jgi:hypothetical protein
MVAKVGFVSIWYYFRFCKQFGKEGYKSFSVLQHLQVNEVKGNLKGWAQKMENQNA